MKRTLFFSLLALVLLLGLMGCSRKQPDTPAQPAAQPVELPIEVPAGTQTDASTGEVYHWEVLETPLPRGMDGLSVMTAVGGKTVVCASGTDGSALLTLEDGAWSELIAPDGLSRGNALCADADGGFWLLYTTAERTLALARYDVSFAPERTLALQCGSDNTLYTQLLKLDGGFCLLSYDRLVRVDEHGAVTVVHQEVYKNDAGLIFAPPIRRSKGSDFRAIACTSFYRQKGQKMIRMRFTPAG